jgi:hypothetical protein
MAYNPLPPLGQAVMASSLPVVIASDQGAVLVSAASLPLPTGAATEATLSAASAKLPASLGQKLMAASLAVVLASDQSTMPVSLASVPLPSGAATEATLSALSAKHPASLGQKTMANSMAVVLASDQSAVPVTGTFWQATQPVSGTFWQATQPVSVASLPLPTGASTEATLSAMSAKLPASLGQKAMAASLAVVLASDQSIIPVYTPNTVVGPTSITARDLVVAAPGGAGVPLSGASTAGSYVSAACVGGESTFHILKGAGTYTGSVYWETSLNSTDGVNGTWVSVMAQQLGINETVLANSSSTNTTEQWRGSAGGAKYVRARLVGSAFTSGPAITIALSSGPTEISLCGSLPAGTNVIGSLAANQSVNLAQIAGTATSVNSGNKDAGTQRTVVATDQLALPTWGHGATGAAVPVNVVYNGARVATSNPTNAVAGNAVGLMADKAGRLVVTRGHVRELVSWQRTALAANTETTIVTAGGAGVFKDIVQIIITTAGAAAATLTLRDGTAGTTVMILNYPNAALAPGTPLILNFDPPLSQAAAASNWTIQNSVATATNVFVRFINNL